VSVVYTHKYFDDSLDTSGIQSTHKQSTLHKLL